MAYSSASIAFLFAALATAAAFDVTSRKIPNWVTVPLLVTGLAAQAMAGGLGVLGRGLLASAGLFVVLFPFWARGFVGGGDLKVGVAAAAWVGLARMPRYLAATAIAGGVLAAVYYLRVGAGTRRAIRANVLQLHVPTWSAAVQAQGTGVLVPYGAAFAAGALFAVLG